MVISHLETLDILTPDFMKRSDISDINFTYDSLENIFFLNLFKTNLTAIKAADIQHLNCSIS